MALYEFKMRPYLPKRCEQYHLLKQVLDNAKQTHSSFPVWQFAKLANHSKCMPVDVSETNADKLSKRASLYVFSYSIDCLSTNTAHNSLEGFG